MNDQQLHDPRGRMHRVKRLMPDDVARAFLRTQKVAHAATVDAAGWAYVVPLIYIYEGGNQLSLRAWLMAHGLPQAVRDPRQSRQLLQRKGGVSD